MPGGMYGGKKKIDYLMRIIAIIHAIIVTVMAYFGCFTMCDEPGANIFTSRQCLLTPKLFHAVAAIITIGYLTFDFVMTILIHENTTLIYQTYAHHIAGAVSFYSALVLRPNLPTAFVIGAVANQFTEISTPFMNFR